MDLEAIRELVRLMKENHLTEIDVESGGEHIRLRAEPAHATPAALAYPALPPTALQLAPPTLPEGEAAGRVMPAPAEAATSLVIIKSPIVGTFYRAASPDKPPLVSEGDAIDENTVLCIIEAMKVMNEIKAETRGVVREVLVQNGQPVEFGQPLFAIEPEE